MADIHTYTEEKQFSRSNNNCEAGIGLPQSNQYNRVLARIITKGWGRGHLHILGVLILYSIVIGTIQ